MMNYFCGVMSQGELIFVGLGLYDEDDLSVKGVHALRTCDTVYAEFYTSRLTGTTKNKIEKKIGKKIEVLSREETEKADRILDSAVHKKVVFLVCGDPMIATTHVDLRLRAIERGIPTKIIHSSSIVTAVPGLLGLQNYKFGRTTTLAFPEKNYFPMSPYQIIRDNKKMGLHTLVLLDIKADEDRYMTANEGIELLVKMEKEFGANVLGEDSIVCVVARAGSLNPLVLCHTVDGLRKKDFGPPLHTLVIPGTLHFMEIESLVKLAGLPEEIAKKIQKL